MSYFTNNKEEYLHVLKQRHDEIALWTEAWFKYPRNRERIETHLEAAKQQMRVMLNLPL